MGPPSWRSPHVPDRTVLVFLGDGDRDEITVIDALADWDKDDGPPNSRSLFYRWTRRTSGGGKIRGNHVFAVEGELRIFGG